MKPLAKELIAKYGNLAKVVNTPDDILKQTKGVGNTIVAALKLVHEAAARLIKEGFNQNSVIDGWQALLDYCRATMGHLNIEQFRALYLDKKNTVIEDVLQEIGTVDYVPIIPREIIKKAILLDASAIILVHNHPSGSVKPSKADIEVTKQILQAAKLHNIILHDHVIISSKAHYSFRTNGVI